MWREPAIILGMTYKFVPVLNARRRWVCLDRDKALFFKALFDPILERTVLHMLTAFVCRYAGFAFRYALGDEAMAGWNNPYAPIVFEDVTVLSPSTIKPEIEDDVFTGISQGGEIIPALYALWYTHNAYRVFGNLYGWSDIEPAARPWFSKYLAYALMDRHIEDRIIPPTEIGYPSQMADGSTSVIDPDEDEEMTLAELARAIGEDMRSGDVVAMPTDRWENPVTGEQAGEPLWHLKFHEIPDSLSSLKEVYTIADSEMFRSMQIPPSILLRMGEGWQSGASVENIVQALYDAAIIDIKEIDAHFNILAERMDRLNYPADSPPCRVKTIGLSGKDQQAIRQLAVVLANRPGGASLDEVIDGPRFWEELGVPVKEEGFPAIEVPEEGLDVRPIAIDPVSLASDESEPGEKIVAKFAKLPRLVADDAEAMAVALERWHVDLSKAKAQAVEEITDEEWEKAEPALLAARRLLYTPADLRAIEATMTPVQRLVFLRSAWGVEERGSLADAIHVDSLKAAESTLLDAGRKIWGDAFDRDVSLSDPGLLAEIKALSFDAASRVTMTHNYELARQIVQIGVDAPRANRFVYAKRLRDWEAGRAAWKGPQIALDRSVQTMDLVMDRFMRKNRGLEGQFAVEPGPWAVPLCDFDCSGAVQGGPYELSEWNAVDPFPRHNHCPHHKRLLAVANPPEQSEAWLG
jgi:hypothetical protein